MKIIIEKMNGVISEIRGIDFINSMETRYANLLHNKLLNGLAIIFLLMPDSIKYLPIYTNLNIFSVIYKIWYILQIFSIVFVFHQFIFYGKFNQFILIFYILMCGLLISTTVADGNYMAFIKNIVISWSFVSYFSIDHDKEVMKYVLNLLYIYIGALIILNFVTVLAFPNSLYIDSRNMRVNWIFGNYQQNINWYLLFLFLYGKRYENFYEEKQDFENLFFIFIFVLMLINTYIHWSAVSIVTLSFFIVSYIFFVKFSVFQNALSILKVFILNTLVTILLVFFKIHHYFSVFITKILRKNITISGREMTWERSLEYIKARPVFGNGIELANKSVEKLKYRTLHNQYLQFLYTGGIVYYSLMLILVYITNKRLIKNKKLKSSKIMIISIQSYFIYFLAESKISLHILFLMLVLAYTDNYKLLKKEGELDE